jgi:hypothetical protein
MSENDLEKIKEEFYNKGFIAGAITIIAIVVVSIIIL